MRDFVALPLNDMAAAYDPSYGDITLQLEFPVDFAEGDTVVPMLGIIDPATGLVTWVVLDAVVNADGFVEITFTEKCSLRSPRTASPRWPFSPDQPGFDRLGRSVGIHTLRRHPRVGFISLEPESIITKPEQIPGAGLAGTTPAGLALFR